jgi:ubiquinone/menaquinone biosynthesis C-methylase UbiE
MDRSEKFWDRISSMYAKQSISDVDTYQFKHKKIKSMLSPDDTVFDYGCGTASLSIELSSNVREIHAIDISSKMLEIATQRIDKKNIKNIKIRKSSISDVDFVPGSYDVVLAVNIFHFINDIGSDLNRICQMLKPGGVLISETPCMGEDRRFSNKLMYYLGKIGLIPELNMLSFEAFENCISESGFSITYKKNLSKTPRDYFVIARKV